MALCAQRLPSLARQEGAQALQSPAALLLMPLPIALSRKEEVQIESPQSPAALWTHLSYFYELLGDIGGAGLENAHQGCLSPSTLYNPSTGGVSPCSSHTDPFTKLLNLGTVPSQGRLRPLSLPTYSGPAAPRVTSSQVPAESQPPASPTLHLQPQGPSQVASTAASAWLHTCSSPPSTLPEPDPRGKTSMALPDPATE